MKLVRGLAWLMGGLTVLGSGVYFFIYLYVWEFHRGLIAGVIFLAAEVAVVAALVLRRLRTLVDERSSRGGAPDPAVLARISEAAPSRQHFAWLAPRDGRLHVFVTVLLGGGLVVSAIAWLVERIARGTATPALERGLASRMSTIGFPAGGLVASDGELLAQEGPYSEDADLQLLLGPGASGGASGSGRSSSGASSAASTARGR